LFAGLLLAGGGGAVLAQQPAAPVPTTIPADVVQILMKSGGLLLGSDPVDLRVGPPPADFPLDVLPAGSQVAVTAVSPTRGTTVVAATSKEPEAAWADFETHLGTPGWQLAGPVMRGFAARSLELPISVCRDAMFGAVSFYPRAQGGSYVRVTITKDPRRVCSTSPIQAAFADVVIPAMPPPPDAKTVGGMGGGGSLDYLTSAVRLETTMKASDLVAYYARHFTMTGWHVEERMEGKTVAAATLTVTSKTGDRVTGYLMAVALQGTGDLDVSLRIVRNARNEHAPVIGPTVTTLTPVGRGN